VAAQNKDIRNSSGRNRQLCQHTKSCAVINGFAYATAGYRIFLYFSIGYNMSKNPFLF
jgi:hypothetical protein